MGTLTVFGPRAPHAATVIASLISNPHEGNPAVRLVERGGGERSHFIVLGTSCLIHLQRRNDLISIPPHELRRRERERELFRFTSGKKSTSQISVPCALAGEKPVVSVAKNKRD